MIELRAFLAGLATDVAKLGEFVTNPEQAIADADLADEDRTALRSGDQGAIYGRLVGDDLAFAMTPPVVLLTGLPLQPSDYGGGVGFELASETQPPAADEVLDRPDTTRGDQQELAFGAGHIEAATTEESPVDEGDDPAARVLDRPDTTRGEEPELAFGAGHVEAATTEESPVDEALHRAEAMLDESDDLPGGDGSEPGEDVVPDDGGLERHPALGERNLGASPFARPDTEPSLAEEDAAIDGFDEDEDEDAAPM